MNFIRSITCQPTAHRYGWNQVLSLMRERFHDGHGIEVDDWVEASFFWDKEPKVKENEWIGFIHCSEAIPFPYSASCSMACLFRMPVFIESLKTCKRLITLCKWNESALEQLLEEFKIEGVETSSLFYSIKFDFPEFEMERFIESPKVINLGFWMRNFEPFTFLKSLYPKIALVNSTVEVDRVWEFYSNRAIFTSQCTRAEIHPVSKLPWVDNATYDLMLSSSVCFMNLMGEGANTSVIECIARNTPLLVNPTYSAVEYLGKDYPFYYYSLEQAEDKLRSKTLIEDTHNYLKSIDKTFLSHDTFLNSFSELV